jgi:hypothetical protein
MKTGKTLVELASEIERQQDQKRDFIAPTKSLGFRTVAIDNVADVQFEMFGEDNECQAFTPTELFHDQIGQRLNIPAKYYDRMRFEAPELLTRNVNHWFQTGDDRRMIRTLDGKARAFLSDRYRPLDNAELASAVLPVLSSIDGIKIESCEITERRMYIKAVNERMQGDVAVGDPVQAGLVIRNSEVGAGSLAIEPLIFRLVCLNGMISADHSLKKYHVGRINDGNESNNWEIFNDRTREVSDQAVWLQVRDLTKAAVSESLFTKQLDVLREAAGQKIEGDPVTAIEVVQKKFSFTDEDKGGILRHLIEGGDLSRWGVTNAITRHSQDVDDYDKATDFERMGGQVIELKARDWEEIAVA